MAKFMSGRNTITQEDIDYLMNTAKKEVITVGDKTTVCVVTLKNGFVITESSSCIDPSNYNEELGSKICLEKIESKLWELEGYYLQKKLYENRMFTDDMK